MAPENKQPPCKPLARNICPKATLARVLAKGVLDVLKAQSETVMHEHCYKLAVQQPKRKVTKKHPGDGTYTLG